MRSLLEAATLTKESDLGHSPYLKRQTEERGAEEGQEESRSDTHARGGGREQVGTGQDEEADEEEYL